MANDTSTTPWILDTASATPITTETLRPRGIRWIGATTAGHECILQDQAGRRKWHSVAGGANHVEADDLNGIDNLWDGVILATLGSGVVYLEL